VLAAGLRSVETPTDGAANHHIVSGGQLQGLFDLLASAAAVAEARGQIAGVGACRAVTRIVLQGIEGQFGAPPDIPPFNRRVADSAPDSRYGGRKESPWRSSKCKSEPTDSASS